MENNSKNQVRARMVKMSSIKSVSRDEKDEDPELDQKKSRGLKR